MKYRVTTRGWVVLFIILATTLFLLINSIDNNEDELNNSDIILEDLTDTTPEDIIDVTTENSIDVTTENSTDVTTENSTDVTTEDITDTTPEDITDVTPEDTTDALQGIDSYENYNMTIYFDKNNYILADEYKEFLDTLIETIKKENNYILVIEGHINGYPDYKDGEYGLNISEKRATVVRDYLIENIEGNIEIIIENKGSSDQVDISNNKENHYLNRRSVLYFKQK